jgi:hypothetical protein
MADNATNKTLVTVVVVIVVAIIGYALLTMPDNRTTSERVGDAVSELPNLERAGEQLEKRTPGQKLGDAIEDAGEDVKRNTAPSTQ